MMGIIFCVFFLIVGVLAANGGAVPRWEVYACLGISALWYIGWHLSTIWTKLKEIQEGLYAHFYMQNKEVLDKEKGIKE